MTNTKGISVIEHHTSCSMDDDDLFLEPLSRDGSTPMNVLDERFRSISDEILGKSDPFVCDDDLALSKMFAVLPYKIGVLVACLDCLLPSVLPKRAILAGNGADFSVEFRSAHDSVGKAAEVFEPFFFFQLVHSLWVYQDVVARYAPEAMSYVPLDRLVTDQQIQSDPILRCP